LHSLTAAAGLRSPTEFGRHHAVYRDVYGRVWSAAQLFPYPAPARSTRESVRPGGPGTRLDELDVLRAREDEDVEKPETR
jgi:hypothetical protein